MFFRRLNKDICVGLSIPRYAEALFALTDQNRDWLKQWLPWPDRIQHPEDTRVFILEQLRRFRRAEALHETIFYRGEPAGVLGFNRIDARTGIGYLGYWLGQAYTGRGIMTLSVKDLLCLGFEYYDLRKIDIRCAAGNKKSRAIPERLGFRREGTLREVERVNGRYLDHVVYGLLAAEYRD